MTLRPLMLPVCVLIAALLAACAAGGARSTPEVYRAFRSLNVPPDYEFWYFNQENSPYAVVGLQRPWRIEDLMWTPVAPGTDAFAKVVGLVGDFPVPGSTTYGATLVDAHGGAIGMWYSSLIPGVRLDPGSRIVSISIQRSWRKP